MSDKIINDVEDAVVISESLSKEMCGESVKDVKETNMNIYGPGIQHRSLKPPPIYATERAPIPPYFKSGNDDADWEWDPNLQTYRKLKDILEEERKGGNNNE